MKKNIATKFLALCMGTLGNLRNLAAVGMATNVKMTGLQLLNVFAFSHGLLQCKFEC